MLIKFGKKFSKQYDKAPAKIKQAFNKRLEIFAKNPFYPQLNNHSLSGNNKEFRSINITGDWRVIYQEEGGVVIFIALGTHSQLYK